MGSFLAGLRPSAVPAFTGTASPGGPLAADLEMRHRTTMERYGRGLHFRGITGPGLGRDLRTPLSRSRHVRSTCRHRAQRTRRHVAARSARAETPSRGAKAPNFPNPPIAPRRSPPRWLSPKARAAGSRPSRSLRPMSPGLTRTPRAQLHPCTIAVFASVRRATRLRPIRSSASTTGSGTTTIRDSASARRSSGFEKSRDAPDRRRGWSIVDETGSRPLSPATPVCSAPSALERAT